MGVLYALYRVNPAALSRIREDHDLVTILENRSGHQPTELEEGLDAWPPMIDIDKSWEDVLQILSGVGFAEAREALGDMRPFETDDGVEVSFATPQKVKDAAAVLAAVPIAKVAEQAIASKATDYNGRPWNAGSADYAAGNLGVVIEFWQAAAAAGEAVILTCS